MMPQVAIGLGLKVLVLFYSTAGLKSTLLNAVYLRFADALLRARFLL